MYISLFCFYDFESGFCYLQPQEFLPLKPQEVQGQVCPGHKPSTKEGDIAQSGHMTRAQVSESLRVGQKT